MTRRKTRSANIELTLALPNSGRLEPIDIQLIETIADCRSISAAGRRLDISYRKTWRMVDALNRTFSARVVETFPGRRDGGATVTAFGLRLVALYRSLERRTASAGEAALSEIVGSLDKSYVPRPPRMRDRHNGLYSFGGQGLGFGASSGLIESLPIATLLIMAMMPSTSST